MKVIFFGTPQFAVPFLEALHEDAEISVLAVVSQPDKPVGRGHELKPTATKQFALENDIDVYQPKSLKRDEVQETLAAYGADAFVVVAYGKIIPQAVLDIPIHGCVNVHPSLLPKYRGPSPMQWAIMEGDAKTGISIMKLDAGMDTGPILKQIDFPLDPDETYLTLQTKVHTQGTGLLLEALKGYVAGEIEPEAQDEEKVTLTRLLTKEDGRIDWNASSEAIYARLRAFMPWPGVWNVWERNGQEMRIKWVDMKIADESPAPGMVEIHENKMIIGTGTTGIEIITLQPEGKPKMDAQTFLNGYQDIGGSVIK
jgi:methionyl-tRNA formyltransferase